MVAYSVIIPAYNEENYLPRTLDALQAAMAAIDRPGEIIVVDNNSSDATAEIARRRGARVVFEKINQISRARNAGAAHARAEYLLFVDADTLISAELLGRALDNLQQEDCCGGGATVSPDRPLEFFYQIGLLFWNRLSVRFGMAAGSFVYCRKEGFEAVGGFSQKVYVGEEIWFSINYGKWGKARNRGDINQETGLVFKFSNFYVPAFDDVPSVYLTVPLFMSILVPPTQRRPMKQT
jgi:glycosyltransferase involved in cell wall biosynthesis